MRIVFLLAMFMAWWHFAFNGYRANRAWPRDARLGAALAGASLSGLLYLLLLSWAYRRITW